MLRTCEEDQICTIHKIATFHSSEIGSRPRHQHYDNGEECLRLIKEKTKKLYHIPPWNAKTGKVEVNTLMRDEPSAGIDVNEIGPQQDFVDSKKPQLHDAPIDRKAKLDLEKLFEANKYVFAEDERQIGTTPLIKMSIDTGNASPFAEKPYTLALKHYDWVKEEIDILLEAGVTRESHSSWSAPIVVFPKGDGRKRLCVDYRALNAIIRTYVWPMPRVEDIFSKLGKAKVFTTLDLRSGYHHIALDQDAIKKTAFVTPFSKYEYMKVPFGLAQAPAYFQNLMNKVLNGLHFTLAYLDDMIIFSETEKQHLRHIQIILTRLKQANLKLKKSKCAFFKKELHYLGHILTTDGIKPQTGKIKAICDMKPPTSQKGDKIFLE